MLFAIERKERKEFANRKEIRYTYDMKEQIKKDLQIAMAQTLQGEEVTLHIGGEHWTLENLVGEDHALVSRKGQEFVVEIKEVDFVDFFCENWMERQMAHC